MLLLSARNSLTSGKAFSPVYQQFLKQIHATFKISKMSVHPHSEARIEFLHVVLTMSTCLNAMRSYHVIKYLS